MFMKIGQKIRQIRKAKGLNLTDIESKAGLADGNLSRVERGNQWLSEEKLYLIADALQVSVAELFTDNTNTPPEFKGKLPLISEVQAGSWSEVIDNFHPGDAEEWIACPFNHGPNAFVLRVAGYSMYNPGGDKSYAPGEYIAVDPARDPQNKNMVVARIDHEDKATFKQLLVDSEGTHILQAINPLHVPRIMAMPDGSRIVGVVIGKWVPE
jgi:SOS-response transcriptional repressor LexA